MDFVDLVYGTSDLSLDSSHQESLNGSYIFIFGFRQCIRQRDK